MSLAKNLQVAAATAELYRINQGLVIHVLAHTDCIYIRGTVPDKRNRPVSATRVIMYSEAADPDVNHIDMKVVEVAKSLAAHVAGPGEPSAPPVDKDPEVV